MTECVYVCVIRAGLLAMRDYIKYDCLFVFIIIFILLTINSNQV